MSATLITGCLNVGPFKGYHGVAEWDADAEEFHGEVIGINAVVTFVGKNCTELTKAFKESITDYLQFCEEREQAPDKPFSGRFLLRIKPDLHRELALGASRAGKSLNQYVSEVLSSGPKVEVVERKRKRTVSP